MDTLTAWGIAEANRGQPRKVFDWNKAARIILEKQPYIAEAGLARDFENTGGIIWMDGKPMPRENTYTYLMSNWATPQLVIDGYGIDCYIMESDMPPEWGKDGSLVYWPDSARQTVHAASADGSGSGDAS